MYYIFNYYMKYISFNVLFSGRGTVRTPAIKRSNLPSFLVVGGK